jgi:AraC-like DNA-binding protein
MQDLGVMITSGGRTVCRAAQWSGKDELYRDAKIYHPISGQGWVVINGKLIRLKAGQLYLVPPHVIQSHGTSSQLVIEWVHLRLQSSLLEIRLGSSLKVRQFSKAVAARWSPVCRLIEPFMREHSTHYAFQIHAMVLELVGLTLAGLAPESTRVSLARERLAPALHFLDVHAPKHPSLSEVARTVNLSSEHFHRLFHAVSHTTPHQYALARRMTLAKTLLAEGLLTVAEVAEQCGYDDAFYFARVFRRYFGVSPGRVRRGLVILGPGP